MIRTFAIFCFLSIQTALIAIISPEGVEIEPTFVSYFRWVNHLNEVENEGPPWIVAAFGKPTAPLNSHILNGFRQYWSLFPDTASLPYCDTAGTLSCRKMMAEALEEDYGVRFDPEEVIFTVGACGALQAAFHAIHQLHPTGKLVAITPYYPQYLVLHGGAGQNNIHPIDVAKTGFRLTFEAFKESLRKIEDREISAFVFCDPNNPCSTVVGKEEWLKIAALLNEHPGIPIVVDEAYAEMCFEEEHASLLKVVPELADRIILVRSATKGLSAAGERMAMAAVRDKKVRSLMLDYLTNISLHSPASHHYAYAYAMKHLTQEDKHALAAFYQQRVAVVQKALNDLGIALKDKLYRPNATFYLLADLSKLKGRPLHPKAAYILKKTDLEPIIETDLDVAFHLLLAKKLALSPLSFFGMDPGECIMRITCSDEPVILQTMASRLEEELN